MRILKIVLIVVASLLAIVLVTPLFLPSGFTVSRNIDISATPDAVFTYINDFKKWESWSPWYQKDSSLQFTYTGEASGVGAKVTWSSKKSGDGQMDITESEAPGKMVYNIRISGFTEFSGSFFIKETDGGVQVTWTDYGTVSYLGRWMAVAAEKFMAPDLEQGLSNLKKVVESNPGKGAAAFTLSPIEIAETNPVAIYSITDTCRPEEISNKLAELYGELAALMLKKKVASIGPPMAFYHTFQKDKVVLEAALPIEKIAPTEGRVQSRMVPAMTCVSASMFGDYQYLEEAYEIVMDSIKANGYTVVGPELDVYITDPTTVSSPTEIETRMLFPVK